MSLRIDFKEDWKRYVAAELKSLGFFYSTKLDLFNNSLRLLSLRRRIPLNTPRSVVKAKDFAVPNPYRTSFRNFEQAIRRGDSLRPYLSEKVGKLHYEDQLLNDWGIHHFHLGNTLLANGFIARTRDVAFGFVTAESVFFIAVLPHGKDHGNVWVNTTLIHILHENWPDLIEQYRAPLTATPLSAESRKRMRDCNANVTVSANDGTVYFAPGGGIMSNGVSMKDSMTLQRLFRDLEVFEARVRNQERAVRAALDASESQKIELQMKFDAADLYLHDPASGKKLSLARFIAD